MTTTAIVSIRRVSHNNAFHDTHLSLPINRAEEHKRARLKVEEGCAYHLKQDGEKTRRTYG